MKARADEGGRDHHVTRLALALCPVVAFVGCGANPTQDIDDDHAVDRLVIEGTEISDLLGVDNLSDPIATTQGFRRLGVLWDATEEGALEIRSSLDSVVWTEWSAPAVISHEMMAHAGHVDALSVGSDGSIETDPVAGFYQLRVPEGRSIPTFIAIEPLADIPAMPLEEVVADDPEDIVENEVMTAVGPIKIHARTEWAARKPRCSGASMVPNRVTIHHTVTPTNDSLTVPQRLRQIQSFHMFSRGWCDIGYNFLISRDGRVWRGRGGRVVGAHVANNNTGNAGISFIGTYTSTAPTEMQMCNAARFLRRLRGMYPAISLVRSDVKGHRQLGSTSCPGDALYSRIEKILRKAHNGCAVD